MNNWWIFIVYMIGLTFALYFLSKNGNYSFEVRMFKSQGERLCVESLEEILGYKIKVNFRPDFLKNPQTGKNMELDGFDPRSKIAVEYNGKQHYKFPNTFHKTRTDFEKQTERDLYKQNVCKNMGIKLITVPYTVDKKIRTVQKRKKVLKEFISKQLKDVFV